MKSSEFAQPENMQPVPLAHRAPLHVLKDNTVFCEKLLESLHN